MVIPVDADIVVPYCQSELFTKALEAKGLLYKFVIVSGGQHVPDTFK
ncbi:hypothetical protein [Pararhodonellum marinum]|nr:hypothetical protein [Pararhodonellum marinum]